ncbi:MAG: hypothetical protein RIE53_00300 [Rhodothermales bacterium]
MKPVNMPSLLLFFLLLLGCNTDTATPPSTTIEVVSPDLARALPDSTLELTLRVTAERNVTRVTVNSVPMVREDADALWSGNVPLTGGLNTLNMEVWSDAEVLLSEETHTLVARAEVRVNEDNTLPFYMGGHTLTPVTNDWLILTGGSFGAGGEGYNDIHFRPDDLPLFVPDQKGMAAVRVGHTALALPDDRVIVLGGGTAGNITDPSELVEIVEIVQKEGYAMEIPVIGDPIRRMYHTASLKTGENGTFITLFGGRGDVQYTPVPELGIRNDVRLFELRNDTLFARTTAIGPGIEPMAGHVQVALDDAPLGEHRRYLVHGFRMGDTLVPETMIFDEDTEAGLLFASAPGPAHPRLRSAAVHIPGVGAALFGGRSADGSEMISEIELFVEAANRFFSIPVVGELMPQPRFGHTATRLADGRIILVAGFDETNAPRRDVDILTLTF